MRKSDDVLKALFRSLGTEVFIVGLTWSDEGKGKVADEFAAGADATVRWHGGASAGHNIVLPDQTRLHLHNLPCGVAREARISIVGPLCVLDPELVRQEAAIKTSGCIRIDAGARIVLPAHKLIDAGSEGVSGMNAYGTTKTGMGPSHEDLFGRKGLTVRDLVGGADRIRAKLQERKYYEEKQALASVWGVSLPSLEETVEWCLQYTELFRSLADDTRLLIEELRKSKVPILWEGAHGAMIDVVNGTMPTSSLVSPWSAMHCYGAPKHPPAVIGTFRPYVTRTGPGPMPTEMDATDADRLHRDAGETESTTGRKQRCGWLDLPAIRYTARLTGATHLYLTKVDAVPFERLRVCVSYLIDGRRMAPDEFRTLDADLLARAQPIWEEFPGWDPKAVAEADRWQDLPSECRDFITFVESSLHLPVVAIGNGPVRGDLVLTGYRHR